MSAPTITSIVFSKPNYAPGEVITATVTHADVDRQQLSFTATVTDSTGASGQLSAPFMIDGGTVAAASSPARVWTLVSATANQSVFTAIA